MEQTLSEFVKSLDGKSFKRIKGNIKGMEYEITFILKHEEEN